MRVGKIAFSVAILCSSIRALNAQHRCYLLRLPRVLHETLQTWNWQCIAPGLPPGKLYVGLCSHVPPTTDESYRAYAVRNMQDCAYHMFPRTDWDCGVYKHVRLCNMLPCRIAFFMITQPDQHYFRERQWKKLLFYRHIINMLSSIICVKRKEWRVWGKILCLKTNYYNHYRHSTYHWFKQVSYAKEKSRISPQYHTTVCETSRVVPLVHCNGVRSLFEPAMSRRFSWKLEKKIIQI